MHPIGCAGKNNGLGLTQRFSRCGLNFILHAFHIWGKRLRLNKLDLNFLYEYARNGINWLQSLETKVECGRETAIRCGSWVFCDKGGSLSPNEIRRTLMNERNNKLQRAWRRSNDVVTHGATNSKRQYIPVQQLIHSVKWRMWTL